MSSPLRVATRAWLAWCFVVLALLGCDAPEPATPEPIAVRVSGPAPASGPASNAPCEHGLPASLCTTCKPELAPVFQSKGDWCPEHGFPESLCPICSPGAAAQLAPLDSEAAALEARTIRFASPELEARVGIETQPAEAPASGEGVAKTIECTAKLDFHADHVAEVHAIVPGLVRRVHVELGDEVEAGDLLFDLQSTRVGDLQAALQGASERARTARANLERKRELLAEQVTSPRQVELAEQELASAKAEADAASTVLRMVGAAKSGGSGRFSLTSPIAGRVIRRPALLGLLAEEDVSLATIADTSIMWVLCEVPEASASALALGQSLALQIEGDTQATHLGTVTWIAAEVDPRTRTVTVTAELPNPSGTLRANQFGVATITTAPPGSAPLVPRAAVQRVGTREVVFVREAAGLYRPRVVRRHGEGERVQVEGRVKVGDAIVTTGAPLLRTEIMPGSIGAGCCEAEPAGGE